MESSRLRGVAFKVMRKVFLFKSREVRGSEGSTLAKDEVSLSIFATFLIDFGFALESPLV